MAKIAFTLSYVLALSGAILILCGLASLQNVCHTNGPVVNGYGATLTCSKAYRFEWFEMGLQFTFVAVLAYNWVSKRRNTGAMLIGATSTVLSMIFTNEFLWAVDQLRGTPDNTKDFGRTTLTFVGFLVACCGNFLLFLTWDHDEAAAAPAPKPAAAEPAKPVATPAATVTQV